MVSKKEDDKESKEPEIDENENEDQPEEKGISHLLFPKDKEKNWWQELSAHK
ncbi:MAG: hypothetical protein M3250_10115 [Thermoproteota archaeon]|nr:hypothetical protein [Thermoproteota archaeon]